MGNFDWSKYEQVNDGQGEVPQEFDWSKYQQVKQPKNLQDAIRQGMVDWQKQGPERTREFNQELSAAARSAMRTPFELASNIATFPSDLASGLGYSGVADKLNPPEMVRNIPFPEFMQERPEDPLLGKLIGSFATGFGPAKAAYNVAKMPFELSRLYKPLQTVGAGTLSSAAMSPTGSRETGAKIGFGLSGLSEVVPAIPKAASYIREKAQPFFGVAPAREKLASEMAIAEKASEEARQFEKLTDKMYGKSNVNELEAELPIQRELEPGAAHARRASVQFKEAINEDKKPVQNVYNALKENLKKQSAKLPVGRSEKEILSDLSKSLQGKDFKDGRVQKFAEELEQAKNSDSISGEELWDIVKSTKRSANIAANKSVTPGMDALERREWIAEHKNLTEKSEQLNSLLESIMQPDDWKKLQLANKEWATKFGPLNFNPAYIKIKKGKELSSDIISEIQSNKPGDETLRNVAFERPELINTILGQRYAKDPGKLLKYDELSQEYIDKSKPLKDMIGDYRASLEEGSPIPSRPNPIQERISRVELPSEQQGPPVKSLPSLKEFNSRMEQQDLHIKELKKRLRVENLTKEQASETERNLNELLRKRNGMIADFIKYAIPTSVAGGIYKFLK